MEKLHLTSVGKYKEDWATIYIDPIQTHSNGGGRITVITSDFTGSAAFTHVGQLTFKQFIAQCNPDYLITKLFPNTAKWTDVENGSELIEFLAREKLSDIKELRKNGEFSKAELRKLRDFVCVLEFSNIEHLFDKLGHKEREAMETILGEDWYWNCCPCKLNHKYEYLESVFKAIIAQFQDLECLNVVKEEDAHA